MKILVLNWRDSKHPLAGGAEQSLFEHAKKWRKKGAEVVWFSSGFSDAKSEEVIDGVSIIRRGSHFTVHFHAFLWYIKYKEKIFTKVVDSFHFIPFFTPLYVPRSRILALINEPAKNAWFKNIVFPVSLIGYILEPLFFLLYRNIPFMTGSESIALELEKLFIPKETITIVHHGVNSYPLKSEWRKAKNPTIIYLAQLSPDKGIEDAIAAVAQLSKKYKDLSFWIVGKAISEEYRLKIVHLIKQLKIDKHTQLHGFIPQEKKYELLARAWVLVHPSVREGWGLNVIEANGMGTPCVGYNVVGLRDSIVDQKTGLLVPPTSGGLVKGLGELLSNSQLRQKLSSEAIQWAHNFSWEKSTEKSWKLLKKTENT